MPQPLIQVQPPLAFIPPAYNPSILRLCQLYLPIYQRLQTSITEIQIENLELLAELYHQFQSGKIRFLMAFRHPSVNDPLCLCYAIWRQLPQVARQKGLSLQYPTHFHFIYDRGIPLWAGNWIGWLYSQLGGTPIHRGKVDRTGLRSARNLFVNGQFPMAAAPEGATNGHNEIVSPLEPGIAQLGFWCVEDLLAANRQEQVLIVPVGIQYHYVESPWAALDALLTQLEVACGLTSASDASPNVEVYYQRLYRLGEYLLSQMEAFYRRFYHQTLPSAEGDETFTARLQALLDAALQVAEQFFNLPSKGSLIDRCRRLEQAGWDCIYRDDIEELSMLERSLANRIAQEADLRIWHMRLVESFVAVTGQYVREKPTVERFADTALLMWDALCRIQGNSPFKRPQLGQQRAQMIIGQPLSVSERWEAYAKSRRDAKQEVANLTQALQTALESSIYKQDEA